MALPNIEFHPEAEEEAAEAVAWYAIRSPSTARRSIREISAAIDGIVEAPLRWPEHRWGTWRCLVRGFPFLIVYRLSDDNVQIIAVAHARRRPGYWRSRS